MQRLALALDAPPPGCRLADPVRDGDGRLLLAAGTPLTEPMVATLRRHGIEELQVSVESDPAPPSPAAELQRERVLHLFRRTLKAGQVNPLLHIVPRYRESCE